ncbi:hypothetical protein [Coleofasciculus sp. F4-SAH-05]|uniref:hypothetical protein n=1 Tax=Coleofasciculus sp. F4-SAH-05 TaxID=3069525 RepID=UPI00330125A0
MDEKINLLARAIVARNTVDRRFNIHQVEAVYDRAALLFERVRPLLDREYIENGTWHDFFLLMLSCFCRDRECSYNDMEDLSDRAVYLSSLCNQIEGEREGDN